MTDEDRDALTAYLFTLPPVGTEVPERRLTPEGEIYVAKGPAASTIPAGATVAADDVAMEEPEEPEAVPVEEPEAAPASGDAATAPVAGEAEPAKAEATDAETVSEGEPAKTE
jgi:hypothetical protein